MVPDGADFFIAMKIKNMNIDCICDWLIIIRWLTVSLNYLMSFLWPIKILRLRLYQKSKQPVNFTFCHKSMFNKQLVRAPTWIYSIKNYFVNKEQKFHLTIHFESFLDKFGQFKAIITEVGSNEQSHSPSDFVNS